jgi:hypothetical protein
MRHLTLTINYDKIFPEIFNGQNGLFPIKYHGVAISASKLHVVDGLKLEGRVAKKFDVLAGPLFI